MSVPIANLFGDGTEIGLEKNETLFHPGDQVRFMFLTVEGRISLTRHTEAGTCAVLQRAAAGDVLAEASAYSKTYHCGAEADANSVLRTLPVPAFLDRLGRHPHLANAWAAHLAHSVQKARMRAEIRTLRTVAERLDAWLGDEGALPRRGQWQDLADELGVTREALYRELASRRRDKF